jgi:hypothetical protein
MQKIPVDFNVFTVAVEAAVMKAPRSELSHDFKIAVAQ